MKNLKSLLAIAVMTPVLALAVEDAPYLTTDLTADGGSWDTKVDVGDVTVIKNGTELNITYAIADNLVYDADADPVTNDGKWCIDGTQTDIRDSWEDIPQTGSGNPKIGQFLYKSPELDCVPLYSEIVTPIPGEIGDILDIAAHADVKQFSYTPLDEEALEALFPREVTMEVIDNIGDYSYFDMKITDDPDLLDGVYKSWCICAANPIYLNDQHPATASLIGDPLNDGCMAFPQYLPRVQYIINNYVAHSPSEIIGGANVHVCDIQNAIWEAMEDPTYTTAGLPHNGGNQCGGWYVQSHVDAIVADAKANGSNDMYVPDCGDRKLVVLVPEEEGVQSTVIDTPVLCEGTWGDETAWGGVYAGGEGSYQFPGNSWAYYFPYTIPE